MSVSISEIPKGKLVIRNIGLLLSGDLAKPILEADTVVAVDGLITAVGRESEMRYWKSGSGRRRQRDNRLTRVNR